MKGNPLVQNKNLPRFAPQNLDFRFAQIKLYWVYLIGFFLILALPLLSVPPWFHPAAWGKTIVFRTVLSILIFLFIWQILFQKGKFGLIQHIGLRLSSVGCLQRISVVKIAFGLLIALFGVFLLATIFSLNPHFSFWGSPYRAGGFLNFSFYIIFAVLAFLIIRKKDWQKIWDFALVIGIFVSIIAIFQQFELISKIFIPFAHRPPSTIGGPIFLAIYLLLLSFLSLSFGIKTKNLFKKVFYFLSLLLFLFVIIFITLTRATFVGLAIGSLWFLFAYPKKLTLLKIFAGVLLILGILGGYFLKTYPEVSLTENKIIQSGINRILDVSIEAGESRISSWKVSLSALKDRPILGYGPENFSIGFDRYYDPALPGITFQPGGDPSSWWDRAHNFVFDISATAGIPASIIYLSLFGVLFWQLQRLKNYQRKSAEAASSQLGIERNHPDAPRAEGEQIRVNQRKIARNPLPDPIIYHGIQATFIGYLVANFFSFDVFSTYLILFLLIGYSLSLISQQSGNSSLISSETAGRSFRDRSGFTRISTRIYADIFKWRNIIIFILFAGLVWFVWVFNIKPLQINKEINWANYYSENQKCDKAIEKMEKILPSSSIIDNYLRLQYIDIIRNCLAEEPERKIELAQKATQILKENARKRPYYTRNWLLLGAHTNILLANSKDPELTEKLRNEADTYFEKAHQLSPGRQEVFIEWTQTQLFVGEYQKAKEKAQKCIEVNPRPAVCWWYKGLAQIYLGEAKEAQENIKIAKEKGHPIDSKASLLQLAEVYTKLEHSKIGDCNLGTEDYETLVDVYQKLIVLEPNKFQYHASLAYVYKCLGDYEKAREEALIVLELSPESRESVEEFLRSLR